MSGADIRPEIVIAAATGDLGAFEQIVIFYQKKVYSIALRALSNPDDAFDLSQEVFLRVYRFLPSFQGASSFTTWLYRIVCNTITDARRKKRPLTQPLYSENQDGEEEELSLADSTFDPAVLFEKKEAMDEVNHAVALLPPDMKQIFLLREISGLSYEEIAETLNIPCGTVRSRLARARLTLCRILKKGRNFPDLPASNEEKRR